MKKNLIILSLTLIMLTLGVWAAGQSFGKAFSLTETTKISSLLEKPADHLNKDVKVEGTIVGVCANKGCWMDLASDKEFQKLRIKVKDGDMVFPMTAKGKKAVVEGKLYKIEVPKEQAQKAQKAECASKAKKDGKKHDCQHMAKKEVKKEAKKDAADSCCSKAKGKVIYQMKPVAVLIKDK